MDPQQVVIKWENKEYDHSGLASIIQIKNNTIAWKDKKSIIIYDLSLKKELDRINFNKNNVREIMFLCILENDEFLYYEPSNIYSYNYITKRKEEFKVNDIFPLFAIQIESSLLGLVFGRKFVVWEINPMWFGLYDYNKQILYWDIKLPCLYRESVRFDFERFEYTITRWNDSLIAIRFEGNMYLIDLLGKQIILSLIAYNGYNHPLMVNFKTGRIFKNFNKKFANNNDIKILTYFSSNCNETLPISLFNLIKIIYDRSYTSETRLTFNRIFPLIPLKYYFCIWEENEIEIFNAISCKSLLKTDIQYYPKALFIVRSVNEYILFQHLSIISIYKIQLNYLTDINEIK